MIYLGSDHGGFELKESIKRFLSEKKISFEDIGNIKYDKEDDYPKYAFKVAEKVSHEKGAIGILFCRSSGGVVIAANKVKGIRAVSAHDVKSGEHAKEHNDANVIALPGDWITEDVAKKIVDAFLKSEFTKEERHVRRLNEISNYERTRGKEK
jgi:ribose 5-phosphate isomerase B